MRYVAGFLHDGKNVVLVKKNRPKWQAGKLNGIGGKIEKNESATAAMTREFMEEAGIVVENWNHFAYLSWNDGIDSVYFFEKLVPTGMLHRARTMESEKIKVYKASKLTKKQTVDNLRWLLPLAMQEQKYGTIHAFHR